MADMCPAIGFVPRQVAQDTPDDTTIFLDQQAGENETLQLLQLSGRVKLVSAGRTFRVSRKHRATIKLGSDGIVIDSVDGRLDIVMTPATTIERNQHVVELIATYGTAWSVELHFESSQDAEAAEQQFSGIVHRIIASLHLVVLANDERAYPRLQMGGGRSASCSGYVLVGCIRDENDTSLHAMDGILQPHFRLCWAELRASQVEGCVCCRYFPCQDTTTEMDLLDFDEFSPEQDDICLSGHALVLKSGRVSDIEDNMRAPEDVPIDIYLSFQTEKEAQFWWDMVFFLQGKGPVDPAADVSIQENQAVQLRRRLRAVRDDINHSRSQPDCSRQPLMTRADEIPMLQQSEETLRADYIATTARHAEDNAREMTGEAIAQCNAQTYSKRMHQNSQWATVEYCP